MRFLKGTHYPHPPRGPGRGRYYMSDAARCARRRNLSKSRLRSDRESLVIKILIWQSCFSDGPRPSQRSLGRQLGVCPSYVCKIQQQSARGLDALGEVYLAAGQGTAAAAEFQKILDHSGVVWNCWTGALAHLGVARANALRSRTSQSADADAARTRALAAYKDFLTLWKDADPDIPILKQAKAEYAKLQ